MANTEVGKWLEKKFLAWQSEQGERKTIEAFAAYIGVTRGAFNKWMNGTRTPDAEYVDRIAERLGPEIYDLLNLPRPDPMLQLIIRQWGELPEEIKNRVASIVEKHGQTTQEFNSRVGKSKQGTKT